MHGSYVEKIQKPKVQKFARVERDPKRDKTRKQDFSKRREQKRGMLAEDSER